MLAAIPAMAVDVELGGSYEANGYLRHNPWKPLLILFNDTIGEPLREPGNFNTDHYGRPGISHDLKAVGYQVIYVTAAFAPMENVALKATIGYSEPGETVSGSDNHVGWEYDLGVKVKLMDNLTYKATFGYLLPGDLWKDVPGGSDDSRYSFFHELKVTF